MNIYSSYPKPVGAIKGMHDLPKLDPQQNYCKNSKIIRNTIDRVLETVAEGTGSQLWENIDIEIRIHASGSSLGKEGNWLNPRVSDCRFILTNVLFELYPKIELGDGLDAD